MFPGLIGSAESVFTIERSADVVTVSVSVAESFAPFGSAIGDDVIDAVLARVTSAESDGSASVSSYEMEAPGASAALVVHVNEAPRTQSGSDSVGVVPAGIGSSITTPAGSVDGPLLVTVIV